MKPTTLLEARIKAILARFQREQIPDNFAGGVIAPSRILGDIYDETRYDFERPPSPEPLKTSDLAGGNPIDR